MGMCVALCTLGDDNIRRVLADPPLILRVLGNDDPDAQTQARGAGTGWWSRLFGRRPAAAPAVVAEPFAPAPGEIVHTDVDKAWHGIHYLLTGSAGEGRPPLDFLLAGGRPAGDVDVGYGPARLFTAAETQAIHAALAPIDEAELRRRYDPQAMTRADVYPSIWDRDPAEDDALGYCVDFYAELKEFVADAAARGVGLVVHVS